MTPVTNMGPFGLSSLKGNGFVNAVPSFRNQLPITRGGIAAKDLKFGIMVSCDPANPTHFYPGLPDEDYIVCGVSMMDPTIMTNDPGMNDRYFASRPATIVMMGILQFNYYDLQQDAPAINYTVWGNKKTGEIAFNDGTDISATGDGYVKLNAYVVDVDGPNGADVFFQIPFVLDADKTSTLVKVATPVADPVAGAVDSGTIVQLTTTTPGARILYTIDGSEPDWQSEVFDPQIGIAITAAVTINAIAVADGMDPSDKLTAAYTLN